MTHADPNYPRDPMQVDTPIIQILRNHLLKLSQHSIPPLHGAPRAAPGTDDESAVMNRFFPFAEFLYLVAAADGQVDSTERAMILGAFRALTGGRVKGSSLETLAEKLSERLSSEGVEARLEAVCSSLAGDREDAELALTLGTAVATADAQFAQDEKDLLFQLASWLGVPKSRAEQIISGGPQAKQPVPLR